MSYFIIHKVYKSMRRKNVNRHTFIQSITALVND